MSRIRVVNLALPKTGTTTLAKALRQAGLTVADWKVRAGQSPGDALRGQHLGKIIYDDYYDSGDPLARLSGFDAINEMSMVRPGRSLWPQTDWALLSAIVAHHPRTRFVLTTRAPEKTANSMMRWRNLGSRRLPQADIPGMPSGFGVTEAHLARWIEGHYQFCRRVFAGSDAFMEYDIEDDSAPERIGAFLGLDLPWWGQANVGKPAQEAG